MKTFAWKYLFLVTLVKSQSYNHKATSMTLRTVHNDLYQVQETDELILCYFGHLRKHHHVLISDTCESTILYPRIDLMCSNRTFAEALWYTFRFDIGFRFCSRILTMFYICHHFIRFGEGCNVWMYCYRETSSQGQSLCMNDDVINSVPLPAILRSRCVSFYISV